MSGPRAGATGVALTKGDLYTVNAAGQLERVVVGADGKVLATSAAAAGGFDWIYPITSKYDVPQFTSAFGNRRALNIINAGSSTMNIYIPEDFQSLVALYIRFLPNALITAKTLRLTTNASIPGQQNTLNPTGPTDFVYTAPGGEDTVINISAMAPAIAANQWMGLLINNVDAGTTISVMGTILVYRRKAL